MGGRVHSREFKLTVVRQLASGEKRPAQICREHNLASSVVSRWRNEYDQRGDEAFLPPASSEPPSADAKIAELERFCGQLALENVYCFPPSAPPGLLDIVAEQANDVQEWRVEASAHHAVRSMLALPSLVNTV